MRDSNDVLILLIKSALTKEIYDFADNTDWDSVFKLAAMHNVVVLMYSGIIQSNANVPQDILSNIKNQAMKYILYAYMQENEIKKIFEILEKAQIDFLPLKGAVIRNIYPDISMRYMGDVDILIRMEQYEELRNILIDSGYNFVEESNHELIWKNNKISIEFHKRLIPTHNNDYYMCFEDIWKKIVVEKSTKYRMTVEDIFLYSFVHMTKHFRDGGIGITHIIDLWLLISKCDLNLKYVKEELGKYNLLEFYNNCIELLDVWFGEKKYTNKIKYMSEWIFNSGSYGNKKNMDLSIALREKVKSKKDKFKFSLLVSAIFPRVSNMKKMFPILNKNIVLLPILWWYRIIIKLIFEFKNVVNRIKTLKYQSAENVNGYEEALAYLGLKFNIKKESEK